MTGGLRSVVTLALLAGLSAALAVFLLDRPSPTLPPIDAASQAPGPSAAFVLPELRPAPIEDLSAALERPLFSRTRTPPPDGPAPTPVGPSRLEATLAGVLTTGAQKVAILFAAGSGRAERVREGDVFQGWEVTEIEDDAVVFERNGETERLILDFTGEAPLPQ
jgi:general secretion pathway protein N